MIQKTKKRELKGMEVCPNGHYYNTRKTGEFCGVCGEEVDLTIPVELTPEEQAELDYQAMLNRVCGWLVCTKGVNKGRSFKIITGKNFMGSSSTMHIQVVGDKGIDKKDHAIIAYDPRERTTYLMPGNSRRLVYLNGKCVYEHQPIELMDKIELGESVFRFVPFCKTDFDWDDAGKNPGN